MKFFVKSSLQVWPLNMTVQTWKIGLALTDLLYQVYNELHWPNTSVFYFV